MISIKRLGALALSLIAVLATASVALAATTPTEGNDRLTGTEGPDTISGLGGKRPHRRPWR